MIYVILKFYAKLGFWVNFRKIYFENKERIPQDHYVIFGMNHPTAFMEPVLHGVHLKPDCWYMLRGDMFGKRFFAWFLGQVHCLPIFRQRDGGRDALRRNAGVMSFATDKMLKQEPTVILSEGNCTHERRLRKIQRGTARMLFQAWRKDKSKPVCIVPVGVNYTDSNAFRSSVVLSYGTPIYAADYAEKFRQDARGTIDEVTELLQQQLRGLVIHVEDKSNDKLVDRVLPLIQNQYPNSGFPPTTREDLFREEMYTAVEAINAMDSTATYAFTDTLERYEKALAKAGITDNGLVNASYGNMGQAFKLWLLGPVAMIGFLLHFPLAVVADKVTKRLIKSPEFFGSVRYGMGLGLYAVFLLLILLVGGLLFKGFILPVLFGIPLLGYFFLLWFESYKLWRDAVRIKRLSASAKTELEGLRKAVFADLK